MKIFIINLEKDKDRYISICNQLENNNFFDYERISKDVYKNYDTKLSLGELGCYLSHLKTYKKIIDRKFDYAIILEDNNFENMDSTIHSSHTNGYI